MKRLLEKIFCLHSWEQKEYIKAYDNSDKRPERLPSYLIYLYCCSKCGAFKKVRMQ